MSVAEEERISLQEAADLLGVTERTVRSYCHHGVKNVVLEHIPRPKKYETSREACQRFLKALSVGEQDPVHVPMSHEDERAAFRKETEARKSRSRKGKGVKAK